MPAADKKIIFSADDFGQSPLANKNILELLALGKLQRISVLIDGNFSPEEIYLLKSSSIKLDLHLDLSYLLKNNFHSRKKTGALGRLLVFSRNYLTDKISASRVSKDWVRQLEKFRALFNRNPDGLNSHEHIHFFPPYFRLILALSKKSKINYLRFGTKNYFKITSIISLIILFLKKMNHRRFLASELSSADLLVSLDWLKNNPLKEISSLPAGEIELIVHPERKTELALIKNSFL